MNQYIQRGEVVIVGGGVAALEATLALRDLAPEIAVTLVSVRDRFVFIPAAVGEPFGRTITRQFDLFRIANDLGADLIIGQAEAIDSERHEVSLADGRTISYGALLIATGAVAHEAVLGATTFAGLADVPAMATIIDDVVHGLATKLVFALPAGHGWSLPLYELALLTSDHLTAHNSVYRHAAGNLRRESVEFDIVTPEESPLQAFGIEVSAVVGDLLDRRGIGFHGGRTPVQFANGLLVAVPGEPIPADRVVAMPRLGGVGISGLPVDGAELLRTDEFGRVIGTEHIYAAGDATAFPVKQGGIAAQQAVTAARTIAATAGYDVTPEPFEPTLRAVLLTGTSERYLEADITGGQGETSMVQKEPMWWPPAKLAARYLTPYLASLDADPATRPR